MPARVLLLLTLAVLSASCARPSASADAAPAAATVATQPSLVIDFVRPRPDAVGSTPERFEWTAVPGADRYTFGLWTETDQMLVKQDGLTTTFVLWPEGTRLDPGTYYWSVAAFRGEQGLAASGLAAFVVQ